MEIVFLFLEKITSKTVEFLPVWLLITMGIFVTKTLCVFIILKTMKKILEISRDEKIGAPQNKIVSWEALIITMVFVLILFSNWILSTNDYLSLLITIATAIPCGLLLTKASIEIGIRVSAGYYKNYYDSISTERSLVMNLIKPWVIKVEKEIPWYQAPGSIIKSVDIIDSVDSY